MDHILRSLEREALMLHNINVIVRLQEVRKQHGLCMACGESLTKTFDTQTVCNQCNEAIMGAIRALDFTKPSNEKGLRLASYALQWGVRGYHIPFVL